MKRTDLEMTEGSTTTEPVSILLVESCAEDVVNILQELRGTAVEMHIVADRETYLSAIRSHEYAVILSAYQLKGWNGLEALEDLRKAGKDTPFLLVTSAVGEDAAVECMKQGVDDYILKDRLARLPMAVTRALEQKRLRDLNAQARRALQESEGKNRELEEHSTYGVFRVMPGGLIISSNPAMRQILACDSDEELKSLNLSTDVFRYPEEFVKLAAKCQKNGLVQSAQSEWHRKDGGLIWVRLHLRYLSLPGPAEALEGTVEDITEVRALEQQLLQAQKFETIGQLAGGIAHDFNNVVGAILGWAELGFEESRENPVLAERFSRIRQQADRAASLTRDLLAFSRHQALQPRPVELNPVIHNLVSFLDKVIGSNIELKFQAGTLPPLNADVAQIEQVLTSLCLNARDAMPDGGRLFIETEVMQIDENYCRLHRYMAPGNYAVVSVSDTGCGMTPEARERIFEPFFTTKQRSEGTGLGLAAVYGIVKQHGGFIQVFSEVGQGSLFRVYLPCKESGAPAGAPSKIKPFSTADVRGTEMILYAEDDEPIREMVRQALASLGYRVLAAADGEQALRLCEKERPALVILDVVMPHLSGPATAAKLIERFPGLPILFTSGYSDCPGLLPASLSAPRYLQKPYSPISLGRLVREILDSANGPQETHRGQPEDVEETSAPAA